VVVTLTNGTWIHDIEGPLTVLVSVQYLHLWQRLEGVTLDPGTDDQVKWRWSYAISTYGVMFLGSSDLLGAKQLWKSKVLGEHKFFVWLVLQDRCWTSDRWHWHGLQEDNTCALCDQNSKHICQLLLGCIYNREIWASFLQSFEWG
jgi:hypothetical protein